MNIQAIFVSDLHLQGRVPRGRAEADWYSVMERSVAGLKALTAGGTIPVFCAGDIFDHWAPGPELVNWAIQNLPLMYAIPGQHDLPGHRYDDRMRGAYGTLCLAGTIVDMQPGHYQPPMDLPFEVYSAPWGYPIPAAAGGPSVKPRVLIAHKYVADSKANAYYGAPPTVHLASHRAHLAGYSLAVFGDNHKGFYVPARAGSNQPSVFNHGAFIPRATDEMDYVPKLGLWLGDGTFALHSNRQAAEWRLEGQTAVAALEAGVDYTAYLAACQQLSAPQAPFTVRLEQAALLETEGVAACLRAVKEHCLNDAKQQI